MIAKQDALRAVTLATAENNSRESEVGYNGGLPSDIPLMPSILSLFLT